MGTDEKIILLAALFREIGKFAWFCGAEEVEESCSSLKTQLNEHLKLILGNNNSDQLNLKAQIQKFNNLVFHPNGEDTQIKELFEAMNLAHRLACGPESEWSPTCKTNENIQSTHLTSIFSTIKLASKEGPSVKYINHEVLSKSNLTLFDQSGPINNACKTYSANDYKNFIVELNTILDSYQKINDFPSFYNLLLNHFEHYFWCLPVDNNPQHTGISLFNYMKDVAGLAHAIYLTNDSENLFLINVELVGKVKYMSNIVNTKPAKILRGRSIFVQVVTRIVVTILLKELGLTDASIVMNAAGKILIVAPGEETYNAKIKDVTKTIEETLKNNFLYEISFGIGVTEFPMNPGIGWSFGDVVEVSNIQQQNKWQKLFYEDFINSKDEKKFVLKGDYYKPDTGEETDKMKCQVTGMPILVERKNEIVQRYKEDGKWVESRITVDLQVLNEFMIGDIVPKETIIIVVNEKNNCFEVEEPKRLSAFKGSPGFKIIINPSHSELMDKVRKEPEFLKDSSFLHVANYVTLMKDDLSHDVVMDFETMTKKNIGGEFLTMIKGDIDNFGIILSCGLENHSISSHSTLSSQLKYFFSFGLNNLLSGWCGEYGKEDKVVYCVYSGGDDIFFVTTQSYSLELVNEVNKKFTEFTSSNPEIHISYSFTNFKHNTPIRIISDFADANQNAIKRKYKNELPKGSKTIASDFFLSQKDKAGSMIFDTPVKNSDLEFIKDYEKKLIGWIENDLLSIASVRYLYELSKIWEKKSQNKFEYLMWHPRLSYHIRRNILDSFGEYPTKDIRSFCETLLSLDENGNNVVKIRRILFPVLSRTIYHFRNHESPENL